MGDGRRVSDAILDIGKGSSTADLVAAMGEPTSVEPYTLDPNVEIWRYDLTRSRVDMVGVDTEEIPYIDPITGVERTVTEPVYRPQRTTQNKSIKVYVVAETVIGWKVDTDIDRSIVD